MMKCYMCDAELTLKNKSEEHIIINAAGGRLKSKYLICSKCNSVFGDKVDSALAKQLNFMANQLMIKRERGEPQAVVGKKESTNEEFRILPDGSIMPHRPKVECIENGDVVEISMTVRDEEELRKVAKGLVEKYPKLKMDDIFNSATYNESYMDEYLSFSLMVGGPDVFRAVCKCAINYFVYSQGDVKFIKPLLNYVLGKEDKDVVWMHYKDGLYEFDDNQCFHMMHLIGNHNERVLYCYVDYFNAYKYLVLLNEDYDGVDIKQTYCFDVLNSEEIDRNFLIDYNRASVLEFFANKDVRPFEVAQRSFCRIMAIAMARQGDAHRNKLIRNAIRTSFGKYQDGTIITDVMVKEASEIIANNLMPYILHTQRIRRS